MLKPIHLYLSQYGHPFYVFAVQFSNEYLCSFHQFRHIFVEFHFRSFSIGETLPTIHSTWLPFDIPQIAGPY